MDIGGTIKQKLTDEVLVLRIARLMFQIGRLQKKIAGPLGQGVLDPGIQSPNIPIFCILYHTRESAPRGLPSESRPRASRRIGVSHPKGSQKLDQFLDECLKNLGSKMFQNCKSKPWWPQKAVQESENIENTCF